MTDSLIPHDPKAGTEGTHSAYFNGCRCAPCTFAGARHRQEGNHDAWEAGTARKPPLFVKGDRTKPFDPNDKRHGTMTGYTTGCRCPKCYQAGVDYRAARKAANA